eukprot:scaffold546234_cov18-Prasinocladus_malaysianus.AAC.1
MLVTLIAICRLRRLGPVGLLLLAHLCTSLRLDKTDAVASVYYAGGRTVRVRVASSEQPGFVSDVSEETSKAT